jgi:hypothetical protein
MIVALTSASLDITLGVAWWTIKQVFSGAVYLGSYLFSESSATKRNKILGDDVNFVPYAFHIVELEVAHSHTTLNKTTEPADIITSSEEFVEISKTDCILTTRDKYFSIPIAEIIKRSGELPLWIVPFLNTYPLTNYAITKSGTTGIFSINHNDTPIFSPFTLHQHLLITMPVQSNLYIYLNHNDVETTITLLTRTLK